MLCLLTGLLIFFWQKQNQKSSRSFCLCLYREFLVFFHGQNIWNISLSIKTAEKLDDNPAMTGCLISPFLNFTRSSHFSVRRHIQNPWNQNKIIFQNPLFPLERARTSSASTHYLGMMVFKWSCLKYPGNTLTHGS